MFTNNLLRAVILIWSCYTICNGLNSKALIHEPDIQLREFALRASFDTNYADTAYRAVNSSETQNSFADAHFSNVFFEFDGSEISLSSLKIIGVPNPRLTRSVPNMMYGYLDTNLEWSTVIVEGMYELYDNPGSYEIKLETGNLRLIWINTKAQGRIAFQPIADFDGFLSTIYDLDFIADTFQIVITDGVKSRRSSEILQTASKKFKSRLEKDVFWKLEYNLRDNVDRILRNRSLKQIFGNNVEMVKKYRTFIKENEAAADKFVDNILTKVQQRLNATDYLELKLSDFSRKFSRSLESLTVAGDLLISNVTTQHISSLKRKSHFSLVRSQSIELIGLLEFGSLQTYLKHFSAKICNIENLGEIVSRNIDSWMFIKFIVIEDEKSDSKYKPVGYELTVFVSNVRVELRGLSFLFSWLQPLIASSAAEHVKISLMYGIEENLKQVLDSIIYTYL